MKSHIKFSILICISAIILSGCAQKEVSFKVDETKMFSAKDTKSTELIREIAVNKNKKEMAIIQKNGDVWTVTELIEGQNPKTSEEYAEIGEMSYGNDKLVFSAKKKDGKWTVIEDFFEEGGEYENIKNLIVDDKDKVYFVGEKGGMSFVVVNYKEIESDKEVLGFALSDTYDLYCVYATYENGNWFLKDNIGYKSEAFSYVTTPRQFENGKWAAIVREKDKNKWDVVINGEKEPINQDIKEVSYFTLNNKGELSFVFMKANEKWVLIYPSKERSQEYNAVMEPIFHPDGEVVYIVESRYSGKGVEVRKGRKEIVLAENLDSTKNLNIIGGNISYITKVKGKWDLYIGNKLVGSYNNVSNINVVDNKLIFGAEDINRGIFYEEVTLN